jgi:hypothetical protein
MSQARDEAGNIWEVDAQGNAIRLISAAPAAGGPMTLGTPSAKSAYDAPLAQAELEARRVTAATNQAQLPYAARKAAADAMKAEAEARSAQIQAAQGTQPKGVSPAVRKEAINGYNNAILLGQNIDEMEARFKSGPGATKGVLGVTDYLPTVANNRFDASGNAARGFVGSALGFTGGQLNTAREAEMAVGPYLPRASDYDETAKDKIARLRALQQNAIKKAIETLGGVPDQQGNVQPVSSATMPGIATGNASVLGGPGNPGDGPGGGAAPGGGAPQPSSVPNQTTRFYAAPIDTGNTLGVSSAAYINQDDPKTAAAVEGWIRSGKSADQINAELSRLGIPNVDARQVNAAQEYLRNNPGYKGPLASATKAVPQSPIEQARNGAGLSALGAGAIGAFDGLNSLTFGNLGAASDAMTGFPGQADLAAQAARQSHPFAAGLGEVVGTLPAFAGAEYGLGKLAAGGIGGSGAVAGIAGSPITADIAAGAYTGAGAASPGNRLQGAGIGAIATPVAGMFGRGLGRAAGGALTGVQNATVRTLTDRNIPLTLGQTLSQSGVVGRAIKGLEDRFSGIPVVGDIVNARRAEGMQAFNRAAFDDALRPINGNTNGVIGASGVDAAQDAASNGYRTALGGVNLTPDPQFGTDFGAARAAGQRIPRTGPEFEHVVATRVDPIIAGGSISGPQFQDIQQGLRRANLGDDAMGSDANDALRNVAGTFSDLASRQHPTLVPALDNANTAFRNTEVIRDAVNRARQGSRSGTTDVFAPSQLSDAAAANARKYGNSQGTTRQPFFDLTRAGQTVLPSAVPDSGTAGRLALLALPAALGGTGGTAGYAGGDTATGVGAGLGAGSLLALAGTRTGQRVLTHLLADRPDLLVRVGQQVNNRAAIGGMFGAALTPSLISK